MHKDTDSAHPSRPRSDGDAAERRVAIVDVVASSPVGSQADLARLLERRGHRCTQATLSRDLRALRIGKVPATHGGYVYVLPAPPREVQDARQSMWELEAFVREVRVVGNLVVLRTPPGNANGVGRVLDNLGWDEVQGTICGDDTLLVITRSEAEGQALRRRLSELTGRRF